MQQVDSAPLDKRVAHWTVKTNYRLRAGSFAIMFASVALHGWDKNYGPLLWSLIALQLLVYPHVVFWWARQSPNSQRAEIHNLTVDCLLFGLMVAALQFPLWIAFTVYIASTLNITLSRGMGGLIRSQLAFLSGMLIATSLLGWHVSASTGWPATIMCLVGNVVYMITIGLTASTRNHQLRDTREALRRIEQDLKTQLSEIQILQNKLEEQATRDPLTGLYNRRYLESIVARELARCKREKLPLALMMIDVDHFKRVNDTYGHPGGDVVLQALATLLQESVRVTDVACRYGGEEFLLLLPSMSPEMAVVRADQWRMSFAAQVAMSGDMRMQATVSVGISNYPQDGDTLSELTRCADLALYRAKHEGRNCVVEYHPPFDAVQH